MIHRWNPFLFPFTIEMIWVARKLTNNPMTLVSHHRRRRDRVLFDKQTSTLSCACVCVFFFFFFFLFLFNCISSLINYFQVDVLSLYIHQWSKTRYTENNSINDTQKEVSSSSSRQMNIDKEEFKYQMRSKGISAVRRSDWKGKKKWACSRRINLGSNLACDGVRNNLM